MHTCKIQAQGKVIIEKYFRTEERYNRQDLMEKVVLEDKKFFSDMPYKTTLNPAGPAAWSHSEFVRIHPLLMGM